MFFRWRRAALVIPVLICLVGCGHREAEPPARLAVLPFENLTFDDSLNADGFAAARAVVYDLAGARTIYAGFVESRNAAYEMGASRVVSGYFLRNAGKLVLRAVVEDIARGKARESQEFMAPQSASALELADELARSVSPEARKFGTRTEEAFRDYGRALGAPDGRVMAADLELATKTDPRFVEAYLERAEILAAGGARDQALEVIAAAQAAGPDAIEGARLSYLAAVLRGEASEREKAIRELAGLTPTDAKIRRQLADLEFSRRAFSEAARDYGAVTDLNPADGNTWNQLGYALAYVDDLVGARGALEHYAKLAPGEEANPLDSLGEVSFFLGDFANAEKYFREAHQKNKAEFQGAELMKAAEARLLAGDRKQAGELVRAYVESAPATQRGRAALRYIEWEFLTGRRREAVTQAEKLVGSLNGDEQSEALSELAMWRMQTGEREAAANLAERALQSAVSERAKRISALCRAIVAPSDSGAKGVEAYQLVLSRKFAEAAPFLEKQYEATPPLADGQVRLLLAWAYTETGRFNDAERLLRICPLPMSGEPLLESLVFPRYLFLRAQALEHQGKRAEAKRNYQMFVEYSGDLPDIWGDEVKARKSIAAL